MGLWLSDSLHDCAHCRKENLQQQRGCPDLGGESSWEIIQVGEEIVRHCLVREVSEESLAWLQEYGYLEAGILPEAGGLNDQYEMDLLVFQAIASERAALEAEKRRRRGR